MADDGRMTVKDAIRAALEELQGLYRDEAHRDYFLEGVDWDEERRRWEITFSFLRKIQTGETVTDVLKGGEYVRKRKVVEVDEAGRLVAMHDEQ